MADLSVVVDGSDAGIRSMLDRLKADIKGKSAEMSKDFAGAFKNADTDATAALRKINAEYDKVRNASASTVADILKAQQRWSADTTKLSTDVSAAHAAMSASAGGFTARLTAMTTAAQGAGFQAGLLGQVIGALTSPLALAAIGVGVFTLAVHKATDAVVQNGKQVKELMAVSGLSASEADNLADTFAVLGKDTAALTTSLFRMSGEIDSGGASFRNLGIDVRNAAGQIKTEGDLFLEVRDRISDIASASQRAAVAQDIFGRGARQLADIFAMSRGEFARWRAEGGKISEWTEEQQKATDRYTRELNKLTLQMDAFWISIGTPLVTKGAEFFKWLSDTATALREFDRSVPDWLKRVMISGGTAMLPGVGAMLMPSAPPPTSTTPHISAGEGDAAAVAAGLTKAFLPTRVVEEMKQLQKQLDLLRATDAHRPIVALNQALKEFADKNGPDAAAAAGEVFGGLINEAKAREAVALTGRTFETIAQQARESAAAQTRVIQEAMAARVVEEEAGAIRISQLREDEIEKQLNALRMAVPVAIAAGPDAEYEARKRVAEKTTELRDAQSATTVLTNKKETADLLAELTLQQTKREQTRDQAIAMLESQTARSLALFELSGASETEIAERTYQEAVALAMSKSLLVQAEIQERQAALEQMKLPARELLQQQVVLNGLSVANRDETNAKILAADTARMRATAAAEQATYDQSAALRKAEQAARTALLDQTAKFQIMTVDAAITRIDEMLADSELSEATRQGLLTQRYGAEWKKRTLAFETEESRRLDIAVRGMEDLDRLRQRDVDNEIKARAALILGAKSDADKRVEIEAGVITRVLAARQQLIDNQNILNTQQQAFFQQGLEAWAAQSRAVGNYGDFFAATFAQALTAGTGFYDSLAQGARDVARSMQSAFSDLFFNVLEGKFENLKDVFTSFVSSLKRTVADFFSNLVTNELGQLLGVGAGVGSGLQAASNQVAGTFRTALVPATLQAVGGLDAFSQALIQATIAAGGTASGFVPTSTAGVLGGSIVSGSINGALGNTQTAINVGSALVTGWNALSGAWGAAIQAWDAGFGGLMAAGQAAWASLFGPATQTGLASTNAALAGGLPTAAQGAATGSLGNAGNVGGAATGASNALVVLGAVTTAVTVALTAMRTDITDTGKAILSSLYVASWAMIAFGGFWVKVAGVVLLVIAFILDITGVFSNISERWTTFATRLGETLDAEAAAMKGFVKNLGDATNLSGIASSVEQFRRDIEAAGVGGFFEATKGQGLFNVPGIPGATGTEHEGKLVFDFAPFIQEIQDAINKILDAIRDTISVKFVAIAKDAMPDDLFNAFRTGTIEPLRQSFEDLVSSTDATIEDVKKFEERMKEVGLLIASFAAASAHLTDVGEAAKKILPDDLFAPLLVMGAVLRTAMIDLAKSGTATAADLKALDDAITNLGQLVLAFAQEAQQLKTLTSTARITLPADVGNAAVQWAALLRQELVALARSGTATAKDLQDLEVRIQALATGVALFSTITQEMAAMSGDMATLTQAGMDSARAAVAIAQQAIDDAMGMFANAVDGPDLAAAAAGLHDAIMAKYALERQLIADVEKAIRDLLSSFGSQLITSAMVAVNMGLERGSTAALQNLLEALDGIQASAFSAATRLWAAVQALNAIAASIPAIIKGFGSQPGGNPMDLALGVYNAALPSLTTIANLFGQALGAGDIQGALNLLNEGATAITAIANATIAGVLEWERAVIDAANATYQATVDAASKTAQLAIDAENLRADTEIEGINNVVEALEKKNRLELDGLEEQRTALQEALELSRAWAQALQSMDKFIKSVLLSTAAPLNPADQVSLAETWYQRSLAAYQGNQTPENFQAVQEAAQQYLQALQLTHDRPTQEYEQIFTAVVEQLRALQEAAAGRVTPEEEALEELKRIEDRIEFLNEQTKDARDDAQRQIKEIEKARDVAVKGFESVRDAAIQAAESLRDATIQSAHDNAERTIEGIQNAVAAIMGAIAAEQYRLLGLLIAQQEAIERSITGGLSVQEFQLRTQAATRFALEQLRDIVYAALTGATRAQIDAIINRNRPEAPPIVPPNQGPAPPSGPTPPEGGWVWDDAVQGWVPANTPHYADGGIAWRPQLAVVGEGGPERISRLDGEGATATLQLTLHVDARGADPSTGSRIGEDIFRTLEPQLIRFMKTGAGADITIKAIRNSGMVRR